jgi:hypothetical protein
VPRQDSNLLNTSGMAGSITCGLTRQISTVEGVGRVEASTDLRQFKSGHALVKHDRLRGATPS